MAGLQGKGVALLDAPGAKVPMCVDVWLDGDGSWRPPAAGDRPAAE